MSSKVDTLYIEVVDFVQKMIGSRRSDGFYKSDFLELYSRFDSHFYDLSLEECIELAGKFIRSENSIPIHIGIHLLCLSREELDHTHFKYFDEFLDHFIGWGNVDHFCVGRESVLQPMLEKNPEKVIELLRKWNQSDNKWKRRASVVVFTRSIAKSGRFIDEALALCENLIWDEEDLVRKGVGWALKDNMRADKERVLEYVKSLRKRGVSSVITLYAIRDLRGKEREEVLRIKKDEGNLILNEQSDPDRITCSNEASSAIFPLIVFLVLSFILHWGVLILSQVFPFSPLQVLMTWTPNLSAMFVLIFVIKRPSDVRKLLQGWTIWRVSPVWYLVASSPMAIAIMTVGVYLMVGGTSPGSEIPFSWILVIGSLILTFFTGATGEELGWRGFLLPRLQSRVSALTSSVVVGVCWGFWHLPLWLTGIWSVTYSTWAFFVRSIAMSVIITWAFNNAKQSVLIASLFHWFANIPLLLASPGLGLIPTEDYSVISTILYSVYAIIVVVLYGPAKLSNKSDAGPISPKCFGISR